MNKPIIAVLAAIGSIYFYNGGGIRTCGNAGGASGAQEASPQQAARM